MKNELNKDEKNRVKNIEYKIFKSIILGLTGYLFSTMFKINKIPLTIMGIFAAFGYNENGENKIFKGKIYIVTCILTLGVFYIVTQFLEFFMAFLIGVYNFYKDLSWLIKLMKKKEGNSNKKYENKDKNEKSENTEINNLLKINKNKKLNSYDDNELLELAAIDEFNEIENNENEEEYLYDTNEIDNEDGYCENCFKKISKEEYELNDGMCEECFDDMHYDENGDFKEDYYDDI